MIRISGSSEPLFDKDIATLQQDGGANWPIDRFCPVWRGREESGTSLSKMRAPVVFRGAGKGGWRSADALIAHNQL